MAKNDKIDTLLNHIIEIKEDVATLKQHVKDQNGKVFRLEKECPIKHKQIESDLQSRREKLDIRLDDIEHYIVKEKTNKKWIIGITSVVTGFISSIFTGLILAFITSYL